MRNSNLIAVSRGKFHVQTAGNPQKPALVMIHGWPESSHCWVPLIPFLENDFFLILPDLRGLGDSERTPDKKWYYKDELAKDVLEIIDSMNIDSFFLTGHDWGGTVAQEIAFSHPKRVKKLIILNIHILNNLKGNQIARAIQLKQGNFHSWYQHFQQSPELAEAMIPGNESTFLRYFLRTAKGNFPQPAFEEYVRCYSIPGTAKSGANYYRTMREDFKRWLSYSNHVFEMPSLYILGNKDVVVIPEFITHIEECFNTIEVKEIEAGHFVQEEAPEKVGIWIKDFLLN